MRRPEQEMRRWESREARWFSILSVSSDTVVSVDMTSLKVSRTLLDWLL
jgi:hypothetical protein